jgi:hypothetical protein
METENTYSSREERRAHRRSTHHSENHRSGRIWAGVLIVIIGVIFLARNSGVEVPGWLTSWPMILIGIGSYVGVKHSFRGPGWLIMIGIGSIFLLKDFAELDYTNLIWPLIIIGVGIMLIFRPKRKDKDSALWQSSDGEVSIGSIPVGGTDADDHLDTVTIFGGVKKNVISKTFRGGELVTIFGGTEINLSQADVSHPIVLDITQIFGGAKLIVPPHWRIKSEDIVSIFGSVEDKRPILAETNYDMTKVLVLKGTNIFGGIDIKSY